VGVRIDILVLFDGAGLARHGLELAGHNCTGVELDENKCLLSEYLCKGECLNGDALDYLDKTQLCISAIGVVFLVSQQRNTKIYRQKGRESIRS